MDEIVSLFDPNNDTENALPDSLPPEIEEGNIEYKLKLVDPSDTRLEHLVTQMKWRLQEGRGEAIYEIGVEDKGTLAGLTDEEMDASLKTLARMAERLGAELQTLREKTVTTDQESARRRVAEILVRKIPDDQQFLDLRLAVLGNVDAGKSTLLGVLTQGELDNGRGRARLNLFRHLHEIQSGRTSSISHEILGFSSQGEVVNYSESRTTEDICENSSKLITLIDLAGHHKYLKTTIFGLTGHSPDFAMLVVSANTGLAGTTREHLGFALALSVPIFFVVTKIDMCHGNAVQRTIKELQELIQSPGVKKVPFRIGNEDAAVAAAAAFNSRTVAPIFTISSVSGQGISLLLKFLNVLPPINIKEREMLVQERPLFQIDEVYTVPDVGTVVAGTLTRGTIQEAEDLVCGPGEEGEFFPVSAHSLQRNRLPCRVIQAGQAATLAVGLSSISIRKGMVLISPELSQTTCLEFEADIYLLYHNRSISKGFQTTVHIGNVCQTAIIMDMNKDSIQNNDKAVVRFKFIKQPEYIQVGSRLLFREGRTKGMGEVTKIFPYIRTDTER